MVSGEKGPRRFSFSIFGFRLQLLQRRNNYIRLFFSQGAGFAGMRIKAGDGDARSGQAALTKKIFEQQTDADDLFASQFVRNFAQRNMRGDERDSEFPSGQQHREIADAASIGEEFGLAGKFEPDLVHAGLVNRTGDNGVDFAAERQLGSFFQGLQGSASRFRRGLA